MTDDALITLDEAAALIPGATAAAMKRHIRAGRLKAYRPGKAFLTTHADVRAMIETTAVQYRPQIQMAPSRREPPLPDGITATDIANTALDQAMQESRIRRDVEKQRDRAVRQAERERIKRERALKKKR